MNSTLRLLLVLALAAAQPLSAVYAPIPEQEQGEAWTASLTVGASHDSNIFGAQSGEIASNVVTASPKITFNSNLTDQTFASAAYKLTVDQFQERPGDKTLDSHDLTLRLAHAFSSATNLDLSDQFQRSQNPESLLAGLPVNSNQSLKRNGFDTRFTTSLTERAGIVLKYRNTRYRYDDANLARNIDRVENLYGLSGTYSIVPELKFVGEFRHEDIAYRVDDSLLKRGLKGKNTDFAIGGFDYSVAKKLTAQARAGYSWRNRDSGLSATSPYAEISAKYDYAVRSFVTAGYTYSFEEVSNIATYNDTKIHRLFANIQHAVSSALVASASISFEPSQLQTRLTGATVNEETTRVGLALTYIPTKNLSFSASYDHDNATSDDISRGQKRERVGVSGTYAF